MTHAEQYSTSEPGAPHKARTRSRSRVGALLALAVTTGITSLVVVPTRAASADQISDAKAQASALTAKIAAEQQQIDSFTSQSAIASYYTSLFVGSVGDRRPRRVQRHNGAGVV